MEVTWLISENVPSKQIKKKGRKRKIFSLFCKGRIQDVLHKDQTRVELVKEI